jgi:SNF2 family DNA or RNA helicase
MTIHPKDYFLEGKNICNLSYADVLRHSAELISTDRKSNVELHPVRIEINMAVFAGVSASIAFPEVSIEQSEAGILISCPCKSPKKTLCIHQAQVLYALLDKPFFRIFFDEKLRAEVIQQTAKEYGMQDDPNAEQYFEVYYTNKAFEIKPAIEGLISWNNTTANSIKDLLLPSIIATLAEDKASEETKSRFVVLSRNKYYEQYQVELFEANTGKNGELKNPFYILNPQDYLWLAEDAETAKFYSALTALKKYESDALPPAAAEAFRAIIRNPQKMNFYWQDIRISENVNAQSISRVELADSRPGLCIHVDLKDVFHEVWAELNLYDKRYPVKTLSIKNGFFVHIEDQFQLITDMDMLRVIQFFRKQNPIVLIHQSKFDAFKADILDALEERIEIIYSYIERATEEQLQQQGYDTDIEKIIYLSDGGDFVFITPAMRYGKIEIPLLSKKQVYDRDQNGNVFKVERDTEAELQFLAILMRQHSEFESVPHLLNSFQLHKYRFLEEDWFLDAFEIWRQENILILGFNTLKKNVLNPYKASINIFVNSGIDWFETHVKVKFGKQEASLKQLQKAVKNRSKYVTLDDGTKGILPREWVEKFESYFQSGEISGLELRTPRQNFSDISRLYEVEMLSEALKQELEVYQNRFYNFESIQEVPVPENLNATLREYQHQGLNWLNFLDEFNFGGCLADDMGLGKTIQVLAFLLIQKEKRKQNTNLVIVPTSLLFNWQEEVAKFAPSLSIFTHHGNSKIKSKEQFANFDIILSTYGTLLTDIKLFRSFHFNYVILDESQAIKNPESQRYQAACLLQSRNRLVLTGTPIENNTFDLYGQFSFVSPGLLGNKEFFRDVYSKPIDQFDDHVRKAELQRKIHPFLLRRTKKQVATELPDKTEMIIYCEMGPSQRQVYESVEQELKDYIATKNEEQLPKSSMYVLTGLTRLRQICNSPALLKAEAHEETRSAKLDVLIEQIEEKSPEHKILVFSQFVGMLDLIRDALIERGINHEYLSGQTKNRGAGVHSFQNDENVRVFLISLKAGGTGLNLTEADYVYIVDPWWNPAVENQAIDRSYRIGQNKHVIAVRLICPDTVEEKIMKLQQSKTTLATDLIKTDAEVLKSLSRKEMLTLLGK